MFGMSFYEILVIGVVALVVLGPERLPKVARTAGHLFGRLQRYVNGVKADISREMEASEFSKIKQEVLDAAKSFEKSVNDHSSAIEAEAKSIQISAENSLNATKTMVEAARATPPTQAEILATEVAAFGNQAPVGEASKPSIGEALRPIMSVEPSGAGTFAQGTFDFGIEPVRAHGKRTRHAPVEAARV